MSQHSFCKYNFAQKRKEKSRFGAWKKENHSIKLKGLSDPIE
jgi:hypothetical protein